MGCEGIFTALGFCYSLFFIGLDVPNHSGNEFQTTLYRSLLLTFTSLFCTWYSLHNLNSQSLNHIIFPS